MKKKDVVKYTLIMLLALILAVICGRSYAKYILTRQFEATFSSYPFYFDASTPKDSYDYSDVGVNIPIDVINFVDDLFNAFDTEYEIILENNDKFELAEPVTGVINGNSKQTDNASIILKSVAGASISSEEKINIIIRSTEPYVKEVTISVTIMSGDNLYTFMRDLAQGQTDEHTDFTDPNIVPGVYMNFETRNYEYPVYYYRGLVNNSIIYADHCWQIVRTTETGGLKIVYDGEVKNGGQCTDDHDRLGSEPYNEKPNKLASPSQVGYMYGKIENILTISPSRRDDMKQAPELINGVMPSTVLLAKNVEYDGTNYTISDTGTYSGTPREIVKEGVEKNSLDRRYFCLNGTDSCSTIYYIFNRSGEEVYTLELTGGMTVEQALETETIHAGIVFGHDVSWDSNVKQYTLLDPIVVSDLDELEDDIRGGSSGNYDGQYPNAFHYTCLTDGYTCTDVYYIYYNDYGNYHDTSADGLFGILLEDGNNIVQTLNELLSGSTNETDSYAKAYIDQWYQGLGHDFDGGDPLIDHEDELEDALWCNDRTIAGYHGWDIDADNHSSHNKYLHFDAYKRIVGEDELKPSRPRIACDNKNDTFTVSNPKGNQKLTYPIALLDADEAVLAGAIYGVKTQTYLTASANTFLMSPYYISDDHIRMFILRNDGELDSGYAASSYGIRPAIALKSDATIISGDGSPTNPYRVEFKKATS